MRLRRRTAAAAAACSRRGRVATMLPGCLAGVCHYVVEKPKPLPVLLLVPPCMLHICSSLLSVVALQARKLICVAAVSAGAGAAAVAGAAALRRQHEELVRIYECQPAVLLEVLQEAALVSTVLICVSEVRPAAGTACAARHDMAWHKSCLVGRMQDCRMTNWPTVRSQLHACMEGDASIP